MSSIFEFPSTDITKRLDDSIEGEQKPVCVGANVKDQKRLIPNLVSQIAPTSRSPAEVTIDGRGTGDEIFILKPGQYLQISMSPYPIPCVNRPSSQQLQLTSDRGEDDWVSDINRLLRFNASFTGRGMVLAGGGSGEGDDVEPTLLDERSK